MSKRGRGVGPPPNHAHPHIPAGHSCLCGPRQHAVPRSTFNPRKRCDEAKCKIVSKGDLNERPGHQTGRQRAEPSGRKAALSRGFAEPGSARFRWAPLRSTTRCLQFACRATPLRHLLPLPSTRRTLSNTRIRPSGRRRVGQEFTGLADTQTECLGDLAQPGQAGRRIPVRLVTLDLLLRDPKLGGELTL